MSKNSNLSSSVQNTVVQTDFIDDDLIENKDLYCVFGNSRQPTMNKSSVLYNE